MVKKTYDESETLTETVVYFDKTNIRVINDSGTYDTTYVYHEGSLVAEELSEVKLYHHSDHLGSSTVVTDSSGDVIENTSYSPYGEVLSGGSSRYDYEGKEQDSYSGYDFEFRTYDASIGMFNRPDNIIPSIYNPQSLNRYGFEMQNSYKHTDPSGHIVPLIAAILVGVAIGAIIGVTSEVIIQRRETGMIYSKRDVALSGAKGAMLGIMSAVAGTVTVAVGALWMATTVFIGSESIKESTKKAEKYAEENDDCPKCVKKDSDKDLLTQSTDMTSSVQPSNTAGSGGSGGDVNFWINYAGLNNEEESTQSTTDGPTGGGGGSGGGDDEGTNCVTQTYGNLQVTVCS